jgi:elongation factor Ts
MAEVSMQLVKELRERTQAGLNDCRSALIEAEADMEKAVEIILKKGLAKSAKRAGAVATEGLVLTQVAADGKSGVIVEVNIQTDFAARNEDFIAFANKVLDAASRAKPGTELGAEPYPGGGGTIEETRQALVGKLGENIAVRRWDKLSIEGSGKVHSYVHMGGRIGVLLATATANDSAAKATEFAKFVDDVAMQVAAMDPQYLKKDDVPEAAKKKQAEIFEAQFAEDPKAPPPERRAGAVQGKVQKWMKEVVLLDQPSVIENDKSVEQVRAAVAQTLGADVQIVRYVRYGLGEGIEKPQGTDFASEVAKMTQS